MNDAPLNVFRFQVSVASDWFLGAFDPDAAAVTAGFAECNGLEATMEPKVIREGGRNYGAAQRAGTVDFATVVLRRGLTRSPELWHWFEQATAHGGYALRSSVTIDVLDDEGHPALSWRLRQAMPVRFRAASLNARATDVGIEELHLVHEGLSLEVLA
jgi:phage tail-like protein